MSEHGRLWRNQSVRTMIQTKVATPSYLPTFFFQHTKWVQKRVETSHFITCIAVLALWSIFSDDIRLATTTKEADFKFEVVISVIFFILLLEILVTCYYKDDYMCLPSILHKPKDNRGPATWKAFFKRFRLGSFYFWLDVVATFSLIVEVSLFFLCTLSRYMFNNKISKLYRNYL